MIKVQALTLSLLISAGFGQNASAQSHIDKLIKQKESCQRIIEINSREADARSAAINRIDDSDYAGLCRFGRKIGQPGLDRAAARIKNTPGCRHTDDFYMKAVFDASIRIAQNNKAAVERDCKKAGL